MGTEIYARGVFINRSYDEVSLTQPALVQQIHREYVDAGADVITTNTFGANRIRLQPHGLEERLEDINRALLDEERPYLLIGFGRWGSSEPWLGTPVEWGQISGASAIVEASLPEMNPDMSQGSHFFHNLIGFRVFYLSVPHRGRYGVDWDWLRRQKTVRESDTVRHVRTDGSLRIAVDGRNARGVVTHDG